MRTTYFLLNKKKIKPFSAFFTRLGPHFTKSLFCGIKKPMKNGRKGLKRFEINEIIQKKCTKLLFKTLTS